MKKNIVLLGSALSLLTITTKAQTDTTGNANNSMNATTSTSSPTGYSGSASGDMPRFSWGIRAGVNFSNINGKYQNGNKMKNNLLPGWHAGINAEIPLAPAFYVRPEVLFTMSGARMDNEALNQAYKTDVVLSTIEVPINFIYKPLVGSGHVIAGLGPYVDFGIAGKIKYSGTGAPANKDIKFQNTVGNSDNTSYAYYRGFGAGGNLLFGYEFANRIALQLNAQLGLTDINPDYGDDRPKATKTGFGVSLGYRF